VLSDNPAVAAVLIQSPNYYGFTADVPAISALCRERNIPIWVDAAHGAHFGFSSSLPPQPMQADAWVVSAHKTLPVPNQGAMLLCGMDSLSDERRLFDALASFMTSSPSWPLLCAIDSAVADLVACAAARYADLFVRIARFARSIDGSLYHIVDAPASHKDPTRLLIDVSKAGLSGFTAAEWLAAQGIWVEMADERRLVLITTPEDTDEDFTCLAEALACLPTGTQLPKNAPQPPHGEFAVSPRCAAYGTMSLRELSLSVGCIAARAICAYPPGCAVVLPGEIVTKAQTDYLLAMQAAGASLLGVEDGAMHVLE
jgi:lysine decarboxylase